MSDEDFLSEDNIIDMQDPAREQEDINLPIELTNEFLEWASKDRKNATEGNYFVDKFLKISPEYRFKFFYDVAIKIKELQKSK